MRPDERSDHRATPAGAPWIAGTALFALAVILVAARERDEGVAFALGAAVGTGLVALLVAMAVRLLWTRLRGGGRALLAPSLLVIAGVVALAALGARAVQQGADAAEREDAAEQCAAATPEPFPAPTADLSYRALTLEEEKRLRTVAGVITDTGVAGGKHVLFGEQSLANMVAIPGYQDEDQRDELLDRIGDAASAAGTNARSVDGLGAAGLLTVVQDKPWLVTTQGCYAFLIGGEDERAVLYVARTLFAPGGEPSGAS